MLWFCKNVDKRFGEFCCRTFNNSNIILFRRSDKTRFSGPDKDWIDRAKKHASLHPADNKNIYVHGFLQGAVIASDAILDVIAKKRVYK